MTTPRPGGGVTSERDDPAPLQPASGARNRCGRPPVPARAGALSAPPARDSPRVRHGGDRPRRAGVRQVVRSGARAGVPGVRGQHARRAHRQHPHRLYARQDRAAAHPHPGAGNHRLRRLPHRLGRFLRDAAPVPLHRRVGYADVDPQPAHHDRRHQRLRLPRPHDHEPPRRAARRHAGRAAGGRDRGRHVRPGDRIRGPGRIRARGHDPRLLHQGNDAAGRSRRRGLRGIRPHGELLVEGAPRLPDTGHVSRAVARHDGAGRHRRGQHRVRLRSLRLHRSRPPDARRPEQPDGGGRGYRSRSPPDT